MSIGMRLEDLQSSPSREPERVAPPETPHSSALVIQVLNVLIALAVLVALAVFVGAVAGVFRLDSIQTGSMRPRLPVGSAVIVTPESASAVHPGQILAFTPPPPWNTETVVHEVIAVKNAGDVAVIRTKGVANPAPDPWKAVIEGRAWHVVADIPVLGWVIDAARIAWVQVLVLAAVVSLGVQGVRILLRRAREAAL